MAVTKQQDELNNWGITNLVAGARRGDWTAPQWLMDAYAEFEGLHTEHTDRWGQLHGTAAAQADKLAGQMMFRTARSGATGIITEHLQPALARLLDQVRDDRKTCGRYAERVGLIPEILAEPDHVREAYLRLDQHLVPRYGGLRSAWEGMRRREGTCLDPRGTRSPLAEVANWPEVFPQWERAENGRARWPWRGNVAHFRLGWLLDHGARVWLPTVQEHNERFQLYKAPRPEAAAVWRGGAA